MKTFDLVKKLSLPESEGWSYVQFIAGNNSTFYNEIVENNMLTLAWVAVQKTVIENDLILHHFKREIDETLGLKNSSPRLLIVTDGTDWFISKAGDEEFTKVKFSKFLITIYNEIKFILNNPNTSILSSRLIKRLIATLNTIRLEVRKYGESIPELKKEGAIDLFSGSGQTLTDIKNTIMPSIILPTNEEQINRYSKILHHALFISVNQKQLQFLTKFPDNDVYVNPLCKIGRMYVCITKNFHKTEEELIKYKPIFLIVDKYGSSKAFFPSKDALEKGIVPNLLKINLELVNEFLTKEPF
jgi:hypothetical protein